MAMKFFEVFDGIHLEERLSALMEDTTVEKLTTDSQRTLLRVYLSSPRLIDRQDICKVQEAIRKQKMASSGMDVKVYERFQLPNHFTAEKVYSSYEDSIVFSIKEIGHVDYKIFHDADVVFEEGGVMINTTEMLALNIYKTFYTGAATRGVAQAKAVVFFILVAILALAQLKATREKEVQQ